MMIQKRNGVRGPIFQVIYAPWQRGESAARSPEQSESRADTSTTTPPTTHQKIHNLIICLLNTSPLRCIDHATLPLQSPAQAPTIIKCTCHPPSALFPRQLILPQEHCSKPSYLNLEQQICPSRCLQLTSAIHAWSRCGKDHPPSSRANAGNTSARTNQSVFVRPPLSFAFLSKLLHSFHIVTSSEAYSLRAMIQPQVRISDANFL